MIIIDSNVWIALFVEYDSNHQKAKNILKKLNNQKVLITEYVILEAATVILNKINRKKASDFLEYVLNHDKIELYKDEQLFTKTSQKFSELISDLSFVDVSLLHLSGKYQVISFDKKLNNQMKKKLN